MEAERIKPSFSRARSASYLLYSKAVSPSTCVLKAAVLKYKGGTGALLLRHVGSLITAAATVLW